MTHSPTQRLVGLLADGPRAVHDLAIDVDASVDATTAQQDMDALTAA